MDAAKIIEGIQELDRSLKAERYIVERIWKILESPSYASLAGRSIYDVIQELMDAKKKREAQDAAMAELRRYYRGHHNRKVTHASDWRHVMAKIKAVI